MIQVDFVRGGSPFLVATVCEGGASTDGAGKEARGRKATQARALLLAMLPGSLALVQMSLPLPAPAGLAFHGCSGFLVIDGEGGDGPRESGRPVAGPPRLLALQDALWHPVPPPVLAAVAAPAQAGTWPVAWGIVGAAGKPTAPWPSRPTSRSTTPGLPSTSSSKAPLTPTDPVWSVWF